MAIQKRLPVGTDDFREMWENRCFVDKTRFIKDVLDDCGYVTLITQPRRFGKSMAMSMLSYFFRPENAEKNRKLFEDADIEKVGERYMAEQRQWPVKHWRRSRRIIIRQNSKPEACRKSGSTAWPSVASV